MAPKGVRANMVSPGSILEDGNTWGRQRDAGSERYKRMLARNPTGRMGTPQEVAAAVVFLAGTPASFVTGTNFIVDGAITARVQY
jgi:3-oxoacyl-[acyl-carrier protein] reductase